MAGSIKDSGERRVARKMHGRTGARARDNFQAAIRHGYSGLGDQMVVIAAFSELFAEQRHALPVPGPGMEIGCI